MIHYRVSYAEISKKKPGILPQDYDRHYAELKRKYGPGDVKIVFNDANKTIDIGYFGEDMGIYCKPLRDELTTIFYVAGKDGTRNGDMEAAFMTADGQKRKTEILEESRAALRESAYKSAPDDSPVPDDSLGALDNLKAITASSAPGVCLGGGHGDVDRNALMDALLSDPGHGGMNLFFIEELGVTDQPLVDNFLNSLAGTPFPAELKSRVGPITGMEAMLLKMRDHNVGHPADTLKAYGINSSEAKSRGGVLGLENRVAMMNAVAKEVMDSAIQDNPGQKFMAFIGAAHSNTHPGGVPGLAQIMGVPAVKVEGNKLKADPENKALRGMPSAVEMKSIEAALATQEKQTGYKKPDQNDGHDLLQQMIGAARATTFAKLDRAGRATHLQATIANGIAMSDEEMAEKIVQDAENLVLTSHPQQDDEATADVKSKKHKELVQDLTNKLKVVSPDKKRDPRALMSALTDAIVGDPALGIYKKDTAVKKGSAHVSIDVKAAKRSWVLRLAKL